MYNLHSFTPKTLHNVYKMTKNMHKVLNYPRGDKFGLNTGSIVKGEILGSIFALRKCAFPLLDISPGGKPKVIPPTNN